MKKQFFYAALAIGMMSSCSSNDLPGNQAPEEQLPEEERVAIELGIQAPGSSITASTKATGAVGGMTDETNLWNGQELYVVAYDKGTSTKVVDSESSIGAYIFEDLKFKAPTQTWNSGTSSVDGGNTIYILKDPSTVQRVYYNPTGNMDFYGYHIDDAGDGRATGVLNGFTVEDLTITGAQDLLGARTKVVNDQNYPTPVKAEDITAFNASSPERGFSAWAARRKIQPILDFKHLLTRFTFTVEAAEQSAAEWYWNGSNWIENTTTEISPASTAVKIKKIIIKDVSTNVDIVLFDEQTAPYVKVREASPTADLELQGRSALGTSESLTATAAKVYNDPTDNGADNNQGSFTGGTYSTKTPVGESLMIPAGDTQITLHIELEQRVVDTEELDGTPKTYKDKTGTVEKTLNFSEVTGGTVSSTSFAAGASYAVNIKVFSFQRIEITAALSKWDNGGNLNVDAE